jgi:phosphonate transport system substrate-binding protein
MPSKLASLARGLLAATLAALAPSVHALVFAVNEGVTYRVPNEQIAARYAAIAADLSRLLKQPVTVEPVADYPSLRRGLAERSYDLAMVHPAHLSIVAIKRSGYRLVAVTKGYTEYRASFLVRADSPLRSLADLKGRRLGAPDEDSITAWMVRAVLRDALGRDAGTVATTYTRYQDAVPFFVENRLTHAGASASTAVVKAWEAQGGKLLARSRPVPIKHVLASPALDAEALQRVRDYLLSLDESEDGRRKLEPLKYTGFAPYDEAELMKIGAWLGL